MGVLAVNAGSSSLKLALFEGGERVASEVVERIGAGEAGAPAGRDGGAGEATAPDHGAALEIALAGLPLGDIAAVGHRVVHGGSRFGAPVVVVDAILAELEALRPLAPLHNGPALDAIAAARAATGPAVPHVATFDTAFHAAMPERAARYAIDPELADRHGIRRYGFHGLAHRSMLERYAAHAGRPADALRLITLQLGNGCSAAAIRDGRSVDTTMGLTPLEGLMMGTRSGDVDPALIGFLARREGVAAERVEHLLNHRSGLLGVSGRSADMRDLLAAPDARAELAIDLFCHRVRKAIGAYLAVLGGADAIVFGGGIGVHAAPVRARVCADLDWCGIGIDARRNEALAGEGPVSPPGAATEVFVAAVDEEAAIARDAEAAAAR